MSFLEILSPAPAVLEIIAWARAGHLGVATVASDALIEASPDYRPGVSLHELLNDTAPISSEKFDKRLETIRAEAVKTAEADAERIKMLVRRIDERLLALMWSQPGAKTDQPQQAMPTIRDGGVLVSILTSDATPKTIAALKAAGLAVESTSESPSIAIGVAPLSSLAKIALLDAVRRIEPVM